VKKIVYILACSLILVTSCRLINPSQNAAYRKKLPVRWISHSQTAEEYKIAPDDKLSFIVYANGAERIIDPVEMANTSIRYTTTTLTYLVESDGQTKLPVLGRIKLSGLTVREAENMLEEKYSVYYNKPFVQLSVTNKRVYIFPGSLNGEAKVLYLINTNTSLLEAIAQAGGIAGGKAHRIKLIRGDLKKPKVYLIDLSTIDGMTKADLILQANDIIYIESRNRIPERVMETITPYLTLITTFLLIVSLSKTK